MSQKQQISFKSSTDKLQAVTHIVNKLVQESDGGVMLQHARTQTLEKLQELASEHDVDGDISSFTGDDFDSLIDNNPGHFTISDGQFGQKTITRVQKIGGHPAWLESPNLGNDSGSTENDGNFDIHGLASGASSSEDDFSELSCLTDHQPDVLKEAGFNTFRDLYDADMDELTSVATITETVAEDIQAEASGLIDPIEEIHREAYEAEMQDHIDVNGQSQDGRGDAHLITDVKIPAGKPRGPEYDAISEPRHIYGLPVLELPTLSLDVLHGIVTDTENLTELMQAMESLIAYDLQLTGFRDTLTDTFDSIDELEAALEHPRDLDAVNPLLSQQAVDAETIVDAVKPHADTAVTPDTVQEIIHTVDLAFEDEVPVKGRLEIAEALSREFEHVSEVGDVLEGQSVDDIVAASEAPVEVDHPFIEDLDEFPSLKTRELLTGEKDVEAVAKILAKDNYAVDLIGHAGVGKDTILRVLGAATNRPTVVINMDESMISQDILGQHQIDDSGKIVFKPGVLPHSGEYGYMLIISEVNAAAAEILTAFHQALERNGKIHVKEEDKIIIPSSKFRVSTTRNPPTEEYDGAKELNGAFKRRLNSLWLPYLERDDEIDLIDEIVNSGRQVVDRDDIGILVDVANEFRQSADGSYEYPRISTTQLLQIIDLYDGSDDLLGATKESIKASLGPMHKEEACMNVIDNQFH